MKIDNVTPATVGTVAGEAKSQRPARSGDVHQERSAAPSVELSPLSAQLSAAHADATGETVDANRVQEIKQAIAEGRFQVNADVVADRLLETVRELLQNRTLQ